MHKGLLDQKCDFVIFGEKHYTLAKSSHSTIRCNESYAMKWVESDKHFSQEVHVLFYMPLIPHIVNY